MYKSECCLADLRAYDNTMQTGICDNCGQHCEVVSDLDEE